MRPLDDRVVFADLELPRNGLGTEWPHIMELLLHLEVAEVEENHAPVVEHHHVLVPERHRTVGIVGIVGIAGAGVGVRGGGRRLRRERGLQDYPFLPISDFGRFCDKLLVRKTSPKHHQWRLP